MENIKDRMIVIIVDKLNVNREEITNQSRFYDDLGADSLDMVELIMEFEQEFKVSIPDETAEQVKTFADAEQILLDLLADKEKEL